MSGAAVADAPLVATGLSKHFGGVAALDDFSITVAEREIRCIVGPNGAGKSTLFKVMSGLIKPDAGSLSILGQDVIGRNARQIARMGVATKLQIPRIFLSLTVREHLGLAVRAGSGVPQLLGVRRRRRTTEADELVEQLAADMGLAKTRNRTANGLTTANVSGWR